MQQLLKGFCNSGFWNYLAMLALWKKMISIPIKNDFELLVILLFNKIDSYPCVLAFT